MTQTYHSLNAELNLIGENGEIQFDKDKEAARQYFLQNVNQNTVFFHTLREKINYMIEHGYWDKYVLDQYDYEEVKACFQHAYNFKFRFQTFMGALKFYNQYATKTYDGKRYLERYEDRVCMVALALADGVCESAVAFVDEIISGRFQPATPTFLNAGRADSGEMVSCFLLRIEDNMESIARSIGSSLQLSKRGGGVALLLSNLREDGAPIKKVEGQSSGVIPIMKLLEDSFSYANQLGARQGAGAVYLHACHPDILTFLDTKRENADEKVRIKTLSIGVVIPDIVVELARNGSPMPLFSPYDVERELGKPFADVNVTEEYDSMVANENIRRSYIDAREFLQTLAELQFESGYPYIMFEDTVNRANPIAGKVTHSNLCSEILQISTPSEFTPDGGYWSVGEDISCNLGSFNIAKVMEDVYRLPYTVGRGLDMLTAVSDQTTIASVPSVEKANRLGHSVGLGAMNLHGYLASVGIEYGSEEALDFVNVFFSTVRFHALSKSWAESCIWGQTFSGFERSGYADGSTLQKYVDNPPAPRTQKVRELFGDLRIPDSEDWKILSEDIQADGIYHRYLMAIPPTGSISYINNSTASIHPVTTPIEVRKEGVTGRVYYPAPGLTNDNLDLFQDAFEIGPKKIIDTYAAATPHVDQGLSLTLFFKDTATTKDLVKAYLYAHKKGIKTLYYTRVRQSALEGTEVAECVSCQL